MSAANEGDPAQLSIHLLGAFRVKVGDRTIEPRAWRLKRATQLIKLLALARGHQLHRDQLVDQFWPDADGDWALASFHQALHAARHALEPDRPARSSYSLLPLRQQVLALAPDGDLWIDAEAFQSAAAEARSTGDLQRCLEAASLYTGDLLPEELYEDWTQSTRESLRATYTGLLSATAQIQESRDALGDAITTLHTLLLTDPLNEPAYASLLRLHALAGRRDQATRLYQQLTETLRRELDVEPSDEITNLLNRINNGEIQAREIVPTHLDTPARRPAAVSSPSLLVQVAQLSLSGLAQESGLIARRHEIELLQDAFDAVLAGHGQIVLLSGEPGIGKTRLAEELAEFTGLTGISALWAHSHESPDTPAFWLWSQIVRASLRNTSEEQARLDLGVGAGPIAEVVPEVRNLIHDLTAPAGLGADQARYRFFACVTEYLVRLSQRRPLVLIFDDLHWADRSSVMLLEHFADQMAERRVLLLGTYRDVDAAENLPLQQAIERMCRSRATQRVSLPGLDLEGTAQFGRRLSGRELPEKLVASLRQRTNGNPFFLRELLRLLNEEEDSGLPTVPGRWGSAVPAGVREAITLRLRRLSDEARRALVAAAVIGVRFPLDVLTLVIEVSTDRLLDLLDEAVALGVVTTDLGDVNHFLFSHVLVQEALVEGLLSARRVRLHARIGEVIEQLRGDAIDPPFAVIGRHYAEAAAIGKAEEAITYLTRAAEQSMQRLAYAESAEHYRQVVNLIEQQPGDRRDQLATTMLAMGKAEIAAGETEDANEALLKVIDLAQEIGNPQLQATVAIQFVENTNAEYQVHDPATIDRIQHALEAFPSEDSALRAHCLSALARLLEYRNIHYGTESGLGDTYLLAQEALAMARRIGNPSVLLYAIFTTAEIRNTFDDVNQALLDATEILQLAETVGAPVPALSGHAVRGNALIRIGRMDDVDRELDAMQAIAEEHRLPGFIWGVASKRATRTFMRGTLSDAEIQNEHAHQIGLNAAPEGARYSYLLHLFSLRREQDRLTEIEERLSTEVSRRPGLLFLKCLLADLYIETGHSERAAALVESVFESDVNQMPRRVHWLASTALLAELYAELGDDSHAAELRTLLLPYRGLYLCPAGGQVFLGPVPHYLGRLASLLGQWSEAETYFDEALRMETETETPILQIQTECAYASMLAKLPGRRDDAHHLLEDACQAANRLDLPRSKRVVGALQQAAAVCRSP